MNDSTGLEIIKTRTLIEKEKKENYFPIPFPVLLLYLNLASLFS